MLCYVWGSVESSRNDREIRSRFTIENWSCCNVGEYTRTGHVEGRDVIGALTERSARCGDTKALTLQEKRYMNEFVVVRARQTTPIVRGHWTNSLFLGIVSKCK